ncbi:uncharacterized protein K452DRAFT_247755 [Aplosporella prunicola CBS 121167]|uniref:LysM domain-containing protein n=1 Tax=Aplosporella prunicola CBS 121167 TaxID=1176127 RepID=A0A6A6BKD7_9PEZI|nr:uncharacterized protein K452DRAFT_247755 [Aplosporella prunicola CBS 121167]KAF2143307.1 hypothetical protein K452DRAFT_247755 [Aplosporella prunicola CBS 121167]
MHFSEEACCTCATLLASIPPTYDEKTEKPARYERRLECCGRAICARCMTDNLRFASYCPFCQISSAPSVIPQGLREPPAYSPPASPRPAHAILAPVGMDERPPAYSKHDPVQPPPEKSQKPAPDVLHFVNQDEDSILNLSLRYGVPADALRRTNKLFADHLLIGRKAILIPGEYYKGGVSLSPRPVEGEEEEARKAKVRRWMVACKVAEYDIALLYLEQADYNLDTAIEAYKADERWEMEHPMVGPSKGKNKASAKPKKSKWSIGGSITGQL